MKIGASRNVETTHRICGSLGRTSVDEKQCS